MTALPDRRVQVLLAALLLAATALAWLGYRDPELWEQAGALLLCR